MEQNSLGKNQIKKRLFIKDRKIREIVTVGREDAKKDFIELLRRATR